MTPRKARIADGNTGDRGSNFLKPGPVRTAQQPRVCTREIDFSRFESFLEGKKEVSKMEMEIARGELPRGFSRHTARTRRQENTGDLLQSLMILQERAERMMESIPARLRARHIGFLEDGTPYFT